MTFNGTLGLNCRTLGVSRDSVMAVARQINAAWMLVQDDPDLVTMAKAAGIRTVYRQSGDETLNTPPDVFVQTRAEKGADLVHLTNELDPTPELLDWTRRAIDYATPRGIKLCIFNFSTDRSQAQWQAASVLANYAQRKGHAIGLHIYSHGGSRSDEWLPYKHQNNGLWIVTEFAWYNDAYHGWIGTLSPNEYGSFFEATVPLFQREKMPLLGFSGDDWPLGIDEHGKNRADTGFGILRSSELVQVIYRINERYPMTEQSVTPTPIPTAGGVKATLTKMPSDYVNVRDNPNSLGVDVGDLLPGDIVMAYPMTNGWVYQSPITSVARPAGRQGAAAGWVSLQSGAVAFTPVVEPPAPNPDTVTISKEDYDAALVEIQKARTALDNVEALLKGALLPGGGTF